CAAQLWGVEVEGRDEAEAAARNQPDAHPCRKAGVGEVEPEARGEPQQCRLEAGCIPGREQLLGVRARAALAAHLPWNVEIDVEPAVAGACVAFAAAGGCRLGGVEDVRLLDHAASFPGRCRGPNVRASARSRLRGHRPARLPASRNSRTAVSGTAQRPVPPMPARGSTTTLISTR